MMSQGGGVPHYESESSDDEAVVAVISKSPSPAVGLQGSTIVSFAIHAELQKNEAIVLLGSIPELGGWDLEKAIVLRRNNAEENLYGVDVALPTGTCFEYKYVVMEGDQALRWETIVGNRFLSAGVYNVARGKETKQSSTYPDAVSSIAVNGSICGAGRSWIARTLEEENPWWEVDLGAKCRIDTVIVWQRDSYAESKHGGIAPFTIYIFDHEVKYDLDAETCKKEAVIHYCLQRNQRRNVFEIAGGVDGRYIRIQCSGLNSLQLAEVQVFSKVTVPFLQSNNNQFRKETSEYRLEGNQVYHYVDDGLFGVDSVVTDSKRQSDKKVRIDTRLLTPKGGPEIHVIFGSRTDFAPVVLFNQSSNLPETIGFQLDLALRGVSFDDVHNAPSVLSKYYSWQVDGQNQINNEPILRSKLSFHVSYFRLNPLLEHRDSFLQIRVTQLILNEKKETESKFLGYCCVAVPEFVQTKGNIDSPIITTNERGEFKIVGQVHGAYLVARPFSHPANNLSEVWRTYWIKRPSLDVGHRGVGRSFKSAPGFRKAAIRENTTLSFITAGRYSADFVEFDVQLSKDRVPVIYHDFELLVGINSAIDDAEEKILVGIHDLTLKQLQSAKLLPAIVQESSGVRLKQLVEKHWKRILSLANATGGNQSRPRRHASRLANLLEQLPTLVDLFHYVPTHVGFDIEIKYPIDERDNHLFYLPEFEMNSFVDAILKCVFDHAGRRRIVFSCFHPDICVLLRYKQAKYPVLFLTCGGVTTHDDDLRCKSVEEAILFSVSENIQGICSESIPFIKKPELIESVKKQSLLLFTWGDANTDPKNVEFQRENGVDGVISDNIGDITKSCGKVKSFFSDD